MAAPLVRVPPLLRLRQCHIYNHGHHVQVANWLPNHRSLCCNAELTRPDKDTSPVCPAFTTALSSKDTPKYPRWDYSGFRKWIDKEAEILKDIEPIIYLIKETFTLTGSQSQCVSWLDNATSSLSQIGMKGHIEHISPNDDGERLSTEDEKVVVDKLLAYHPQCEAKIGCGLDSIMVDRHPQFKHSRCLFVVRTDGGWIDFSYQKCIRAYIRDKYPSHAERFIKEHFKRGSG